MQTLNRGRLINFINGITGVSAGGQAVINFPVNQRVHKNVFQCTANNYTGGTGLAVVNITGTGSGATITPTIVNGTVTAIAVVAGGTGYSVGDTFTFSDATGAGFVGTVATLSTSAIATATVTVGATPTAISPITMITSMRQLVNGINMRDIDVVDIIKECILNGYQPSRGELPIFYTVPWQQLLNVDDVTSWDLFGQSTFSYQIGISPNVVNPGLTGVSEFDYQRNTMPNPADGGKTLVPFLQPVAQHAFSMPIISGRNDINTLPFTYPISRMFLQGSDPSKITQIELFQDGNKVMEATNDQLKQCYTENGFDLGRANWLNQNYDGTAALNKTLQGQYQKPFYYDSAFIADSDQRYWRALNVANSMILRVYSSVAQTLKVVQSTLPGAYQS